MGECQRKDIYDFGGWRMDVKEMIYMILVDGEVNVKERLYIEF